MPVARHRCRYFLTAVSPPACMHGCHVLQGVTSAVTSVADGAVGVTKVCWAMPTMRNVLTAHHLT
jgi:hypothetical protein